MAVRHTDRTAGGVDREHDAAGVPVSAVAGYERLALLEFETWLRQHRGPGGWHAGTYSEVVDAVTASFLRGLGWRPGQALADLAGVRMLAHAVLDAVQRAAATAWTWITGHAPPIPSTPSATASGVSTAGRGSS